MKDQLNGLIVDLDVEIDYGHSFYKYYRQ